MRTHLKTQVKTSLPKWSGKNTHYWSVSCSEIYTVGWSGTWIREGSAIPKVRCSTACFLHLKLWFLWFTRTRSAIIQLILPTICCSLGDIRGHIFSKLPIKYIINLSKSMHSLAIHHWNTSWQISLDIFSANQSSLDAWNVLILLRTVGSFLWCFRNRAKMLDYKTSRKELNRSNPNIRYNRREASLLELKCCF